MFIHYEGLANTGSLWSICYSHLELCCGSVASVLCCAGVGVGVGAVLCCDGVVLLWRRVVLWSGMCRVWRVL